MASKPPTSTPIPTPPKEEDYSFHFFVIASVLVGIFSLIAYYAYQRYKQMLSHDPTTPKLLSDDEGHDVELNEKNEENGIFQHTSPSSQPPFTPDQHIISPSDREYDHEYDHTYQHDDDGDHYQNYDECGGGEGGDGGEGGEEGDGHYTYDDQHHGDGIEGNEEGHATELDTFDILACDGIENNDAPDGLDESGFADVYTGVEETGDLGGDPSGGDGVYLDMEGADGGLLAGEEIAELGDVTGQEFDEIGLEDQAPESTLDESYVLPDDVTEHHYEMGGDSYYDEGDDVPLTAE